ncbi:MAG TPA: histone family protein [Candidatus Lokiarchaeia archaeon]|nr:histone family protein [Candidatus Lokiarchaeia archaeon]
MLLREFTGEPLIKNNRRWRIILKNDRKNDDRIIPVAPLDRLIRKANVERVSESAAIELGVILEELGKEIANRANDLAKHANRTTVKDADIKLAYKQWADRR